MSGLLRLPHEAGDRRVIADHLEHAECPDEHCGSTLHLGDGVTTTSDRLAEFIAAYLAFVTTH